MKLEYLTWVIGTQLIVKVPRPGDSEEIFSVFVSSCHLLLPVYHTIPLLCWTSSREAVNTNF